MGVSETLVRIRRREVSCREVVSASLARIDQRDAEIHAFLHVDREGALARAEELDALAKRGTFLPLHGLPVAVKDNLCTRDMPTTCGSRMLAGYVPPYDAHVVERLRASGAVIVGKTNLDEFAMGSSTEHSAFGPTRNPLDLSRVPGGSSGGSAAAVAAGMVEAALGSDTGGSVRQPAAFCGIVGMKPTYGLVSRYGLVAFASSLDQVGPMASDVEGAALLLEAIAEPDGRDATCATRPRSAYAKEIASRPEGKARIGYIPTSLGPGYDMRHLLDGKDKNIEMVEIPEGMPLLNFGIPAYYLTVTSEASANLSRFDGVRYGRRAPEAKDMDTVFAQSRGEGFGREVKRRILLGTRALSSGYYNAYYLHAQKARKLLLDEYLQTFRKYRLDFLATATTNTPAFKMGERIENPVAMYASDYFTVAANLTGLPAISIPHRLGANGHAESDALPLGIHLTALPFQEVKLLSIARTMETFLTNPRLPSPI